MKHEILFLLTLILSFAPIRAKSDVKLPDTYAYTRGVEAYNDDMYADAIEWFNKELSEHPDNGFAYLYVAIIRYDNQEYGRALTAFDNAIKHLPKKGKSWRASALASRGDVYAALGDTVQAITDLTQAIRIEPDNPVHYRSRAQLNYELQNYDLSDADYQKMIDIDQGDVMGHMGIGRNLKARERWEEAISKFTHAIRLYPNYSNAYSFRAEAYLTLQKWPEATDDIIKALDIDGDDMAFYLLQTLPHEAYPMLKQKLKIQMTKQPSNQYWVYCIAVLTDDNGDYAEAISYYEKANNLDPRTVFLKNISVCYYQLKDYTSALLYADRVLDMNPEDYEMMDFKADILRRMGRFDECLALRDIYVEKFPEYITPYLSRATDLLNVRRFEAAIEDYNTAVILSPALIEFPHLLMRRGDAYRYLGKQEEATKDYELLLQVEKDSVLTCTSCTPFAYSALGNAEKAVETMQYILANDTTEITGNLYNMACIYARLDRRDEALHYLKEAIQNGYDNAVHIQTDYDLDCLREIPEFQDIIDSIATLNPEPEPEQAEAEYHTETIEVPFTKESGITKVKCTINGLPLHFVFDTGASDVTISMVEANFMLKNDYIQPGDIVGATRYMDANGNVSEGTVINLRNVNFGGLELENVRASVVRNQKAPLLLGQSVLGRLGKIEIDNPGMKLVITHKQSKSKSAQD
ncbi:MAG: tetratricopeptide repeat protein [Muribaculaceae bacterium]|nr:tetratricopeptide repeat protein [Muribaculaceae bacterium]